MILASGPKLRPGVLVATAALALLFLAPAAAEDAFEERIARFELFTECKPMIVAVELMSPNAEQIGLTRDLIHTVAESRLRSANLYTNDFPARSFLSIDVEVVESSFYINVFFGKEVVETFSSSFGLSITWASGEAGVHSGDSHYILYRVSQHIDTFLVEFLRVNEEACAKR